MLEYRRDSRVQQSAKGIWFEIFPFKLKSESVNIVHEKHKLDV